MLSLIFLIEKFFCKKKKTILFAIEDSAIFSKIFRLRKGLFFSIISLAKNKLPFIQTNLYSLYQSCFVPSSVRLKEVQDLKH